MFIITAIALLVIYLLVKWQLEKLTISGISGRHVFITGCDSGFGNQLAKKLDSLGLIVFAGCLTEKGGLELKKVTSERLHVVPLDITSSESVDQALEFVKSKLPASKGLYGLVNNAGVAGPMGQVEMFNRGHYEQTLNVNLYGMIEMTKAFLPLLRLEKGRIVNTTSVQGRVANVSTPYVVSKFAAEGYSDSLRRDLYRTGVSVHIVEPGYFRTNILDLDPLLKSFDKTFSEVSKEVQDYYGESFLSNMRVIYKFVINQSSTQTDLVSDAYVQALCSKYPRYRYVVGKDANTIFRFLWIVPEWLSDLILCCLLPVPEGETKKKV